jgi:hypothetical protein
MSRRKNSGTFRSTRPPKKADSHKTIDFQRIPSFQMRQSLTPQKILPAHLPMQACQSFLAFLQGKTGEVDRSLNE